MLVTPGARPCLASQHRVAELTTLPESRDEAGPWITLLTAVVGCGKGCSRGLCPSCPSGFLAGVSRTLQMPVIGHSGCGLEVPKGFQVGPYSLHH